MKTLFLCGAGNSEGVRLALRVQRASGRWDRLAVLDDDPRRLGDELCGIPVIGPLDLLADAEEGTAEAVNLVARTTRGRALVRERILGYGVPLAQLVHPSIDTEWAELVGDVTVYEHAVVAPETVVGPGSVVFMRAIVGHEAQVGPGCVLAAGSVLNARVQLGAGVYVGSNASVVPEVQIGEGATIGANSLVVADVPPGATVVGVPGQVVDARSARPAAAPGAEVAAADPQVERALLQIWTEVLSRAVDRVDVPFFEVGGTSLLALRVLQRIREDWGLELPFLDFYRFPTVRGLASRIGGGRAAWLAESADGWERGARRRARALRSSGIG
jgi:sugar O-acyltransferase (sialic acid O-acetyltransferase NeuD family)